MLPSRCGSMVSVTDEAPIVVLTALEKMVSQAIEIFKN